MAADVEKMVRFWWKSIGNLSGPIERPCLEKIWTFWQKKSSPYISMIFINVWKSWGTTTFLANFLPKCENIAQTYIFKAFSKTQKIPSWKTHLKMYFEPYSPCFHTFMKITLMWGLEFFGQKVQKNFRHGLFLAQRCFLLIFIKIGQVCFCSIHNCGQNV